MTIKGTDTGASINNMGNAERQWLESQTPPRTLTHYDRRAAYTDGEFGTHTEGDPGIAGDQSIASLYQAELDEQDIVFRKQFREVMEDIFADLLADMPDGDAELRLTEVIIRVQGLQTATNNNQLEVTEQQRQQLRESMLAKLKESYDKIDQATARTKNVDVWTKIKLAFEWLGAALSVGVGAFLVATGAGLGLGLCMISIGVISLLAAADTTTATFSAEQMGIAAHMWVAFGVDKETAEKLQLTAQILAAVVATAIAIAMFWVPGEAQAAAIAQWIQIGSTIATSGMELIKVVGDVTVAGIKYDADMLRVRAKELQAGSKEFEADLLPLDALVEQLLEHIAAINDGWNGMLDAVISAIGIRNTALLRVQFKA
jgi:hypothetical protein